MDSTTPCAIAGIGETEVGKLPASTTLGLALEAVRGAIADAGMRPVDIDGVIADQPNNQPYRSFSLAVAHAAGLTPTFVTDMALGGASPVAAVVEAVLAIRAGLATAVVCLHSQKQATARSEPRRGKLLGGREEFEEPFGLTGAIGHHAAAVARHMHEYGTTADQLAAVAVATRQHASLNSTATMRKPITVDDVLESRWVVRPFHILDCCLVSDGAGAVVVTSTERAASAPRRSVYIRGFGLGYRQGLLETPDLTTLGGAYASRFAFGMAGLRPDDVDFAEIYDCFTGIVIITLEDYGFCVKGEGGPFVATGVTGPGGRLPMNTHGGLLSHGHVEGMQHVTEAVKQLRGGEVEEARQVTGATVGIVSGHGAGLAAHGTLVLSSEAA